MLSSLNWSYCGLTLVAPGGRCAYGAELESRSRPSGVTCRDLHKVWCCAFHCVPAVLLPDPQCFVGLGTWDSSYLPLTFPPTFPALSPFPSSLPPFLPPPPSLTSFLPSPSFSLLFLLFWSSFSQLKRPERSSKANLVTMYICSIYNQLKPIDRANTDEDNCLSLSALTDLN